MAKANFDGCLKEVLRHEGGWADHPKDPGGATMKGVTLATYRQYKNGATKADLRAISDAELQKIYRVGYWGPMRGDDMPAGVDLAAFDFAVNSGPSRAGKFLQRAVGAVADGVVGPATVAAVRGREARAVVRDLCDARLTWLKGLANYVTFGKGWARRVADVRALGEKMAGASVAELRETAEKSAHDRDKLSVAAQGTAGMWGTSGGVAWLADVDWQAVALLGVAAVVVFVVLSSRAKIKSEISDAYRAILVD